MKTATQIALDASERLARSRVEAHAGSARLRAGASLRAACGGRVRCLGWRGADLALQTVDDGRVFLVDLVLDRFAVLVGVIPEEIRAAAQVRRRR